MTFKLLVAAALAAIAVADTNPTVFLPTPPAPTGPFPSLPPLPSSHAPGPKPPCTTGHATLPYPGHDDTCTSTLTCEHEATRSIYTSTATAIQSIDCAGCNNLAVTAVPKVHCPVMLIPSSTVEIFDVTTTTITVCSQTANATLM
ncbi:hypothetical protein PT974_02333 [Cladobotryum mycophilum]|uniref:Uncharacterized protein n=1 Tax=Cladobotryum mycophilum TaxID=491253 RepID=A0ABR0SY01_9HYPO